MHSQVIQHQRNIFARWAQDKWHRIDATSPRHNQLLRLRSVVLLLVSDLGDLPQFSVCFTDEQMEKVIDVVGQCGVSAVEVSLVYVTLYNKGDDIFQDVPVFKVRPNSSNSTNRFVDLEGRVYQDWQDFLRSNQLPKCTMCYPRDGTYNSNEIEWSQSPACSWLSGAIDLGDLVAKLLFAAKGIVVFTMATTPLTEGAVIVMCAINGIWYLGRGLAGLWDMYNHGQSINPSSNWSPNWNYLSRSWSFISGVLSPRDMWNAVRNFFLFLRDFFGPYTQWIRIPAIPLA